MKSTKMPVILVMALGLMIFLPEPTKASPMGTVWTYQGRLIDANTAADGLYDLKFKLFDDPNVVDSNQVGTDINVPDLDVIDGYFTVELDFGNVLDGDACWLEIAVRPGDSNDVNDFVTLSPRQELTPAPYALRAKSVSAPLELIASTPEGTAVLGVGNTGDGVAIGTRGKNGDIGMLGTSRAGVTGIAGSGGLAGSFVGDVDVTGNIDVDGIKFPDGTVQTTSASELSALIASLQSRIAALEPSPGWGTPKLIETECGGVQLVFDGSGNAFVVWEKYDGNYDSIWSNRYVAGTGWGTAVMIETEHGDAHNPQVAVDGSGNAVVVWKQFDGVLYDRIWSNRYVVGTGWGTAELIETHLPMEYENASNPQVAVNPNGSAIAVWEQQVFNGTTPPNIWSNRYVAGTGWGTEELIETDNAGDARNPQVAIDVGGNAIAVWHQYDGTHNNIYSNRYVAGTGWGTAELVETDNAGNAYYPQVAVDGSGNAVAVWHQHDGTRYNIWSNRYVAGTGWGTAELIETDNAGHAYYPKVALDGSGNAVAVWHQDDGTRQNIWSNRYVAGTGWGTAELIETDAESASDPQVAVNGSGNAFAVWVQYDGTHYNIWSNRYIAGTGWGTAELLEMESGGAGNPQVAASASGNAIAMWGQYSSIWSSYYVAE